MLGLEKWEIVEGDILVIGGGFGGLWAAIRAAELGSSVILVDKSFVGKSGHSYFAGGAMMVMLPDDDPNEYVKDIVLGNDWLVDQEKVKAIFEGSYQRLKDLESFGINFRKNIDGYVWTKARGTKNIKNLWPENATAADEVTTLRKVAIERGVKIIDHVYVYDLVNNEDNAISGAIAVGVKDHMNYLFKAISVIVATNSGGFKGHHLGSELQGTGPFLAYEAGAKLKNPEFHYINIRPAKHEIEGSGILPAIGAKWINAKGEFYMEKYDPVLKDRAPTARVVVAAAKEALAGNAPLAINVEGMTEEEREKFRILQVSHGWQPVLFDKCKREEGYDILRENIEWQPAYESNKLGIYANIDCSTSLNGLFAAGMARTLGINSFTGWSIASSTWSGYTAGESADRYVKNNDFKKIDFEQLSKKKKKFFRPLELESNLNPDNLIYKLQKILFPANVLILMSDPNLKNALKEIKKLKDETANKVKGKDIRELIRVKEYETMLLAAEMTIKASLMRKETRPSIFYREDYPDTDNDNYLKWTIVQKDEKGEISLMTEDIPFEKYPFNPDNH